MEPYTLGLCATSSWSIKPWVYCWLHQARWQWTSSFVCLASYHTLCCTRHSVVHYEVQQCNTADKWQSSSWKYNARYLSTAVVCTHVAPWVTLATLLISPGVLKTAVSWYVIISLMKRKQYLQVFVPYGNRVSGWHSIRYILCCRHNYEGSNCNLSPIKKLPQCIFTLL